MASRFEQWKASLERLIFAGLKPDAPVAGPKKSKIGSLVDSAEDLAARGLKSEDKPLPGPLTWGKKLGVAAGILMLGIFVYVLVTVLRRPAQQAESKAPPPPMVEIVPKGMKIERNKGLEVVEFRLDKNKSPLEIVGTLRNLTDRTLAKCDVSFDVTTRGGAQLGGASTIVNDLPPHGSATFRISVPYKEAGFVMVRELRAE